MEASPDVQGTSSVPLVVDVDRTLASTDLLWEGLVRMTFTCPHRLASLLFTLPRGRPHVKQEVARHAELDLNVIPLNSTVVRMVENAKRQGRAVLLASAADPSQVTALAQRIGADEVVASKGTENVKGREKLAAIEDRLETFDYVGDHRADIPILAAARRGYLVDPDLWTRFRARRLKNARILQSRARTRFLALLRALRPHQWAKNGLLALPVLAGHPEFSWGLVGDLTAGMLAFSFLASAVYLMNDLADLPHDRVHPTKRARPLAAGELSIPAALAAGLILLVGAAALGSRLPSGFLLTLVTYLILNAAYSGGLKRVVVLDVVVLAGLYTIRVVAGSEATGIPLSDWFIGFSVFFFFSLGVLKRVIDLRTDKGSKEADHVAGRGYQREDISVLLAVGPAAGVVASLIYGLYITGPVRDLYRNPSILWLGLPLFVYWIVRVWLLALRGEVHDDPVVFVLRDLPSYAVLAAFLSVVFWAS